METFKEMIKKVIEKKGYKEKTITLKKLLLKFGFCKEEEECDDIPSNGIIKLFLMNNPFGIQMTITIILAGYVEVNEENKLSYKRFYFDDYSAEEIFKWVYEKIKSQIPEI